MSVIEETLILINKKKKTKSKRSTLTLKMVKESLTIVRKQLLRCIHKITDRLGSRDSVSVYGVIIRLAGIGLFQ